MREQDADDILAAVEGGEVECCLAGGALDVDRCAVVEQELDDGGVAFGGGVVQRCLAVGIGSAVDGDALVEEETHEWFEALAGGPAEGVGSEGEAVEGRGDEGVELAAGQDEREEVLGGGEEFSDEEEELGRDLGQGRWRGVRRAVTGGLRMRMVGFGGFVSLDGSAQDHHPQFQIAGGGEGCFQFWSKRRLAGRERRRRAGEVQQAVSLGDFLQWHRSET